MTRGVDESVVVDLDPTKVRTARCLAPPKRFDSLPLVVSPDSAVAFSAA
jgi:hypothetical protein